MTPPPQLPPPPALTREDPSSYKKNDYILYVLSYSENCFSNNFNMLQFLNYAIIKCSISIGRRAMWLYGGIITVLKKDQFKVFQFFF